jgi:molybdopterin/thiamine biosynthesis adenylyltransferase
MSSDDVRAEEGHAPQTFGALDLPFVGLTMAGDGTLAARFWLREASRAYVRKDCESVRLIGDSFRIFWNDKLRPPPKADAALSRTVSAWGEELQSSLGRMRVGIIGAGSVGALVAEAIARTGIGRIRLMDFDSVEVHNLDRLLHATREDATLGRAKVAVLAQALSNSAVATSPLIDSHEASVVEPEGLKLALDCDVLFSCVDRPWPRAVLNMAAYAHLIPVVDGGIRVETKDRRLRRADWKAHVAAPGRPCLECLRQYDPGDVQTERDGWLDDPTYIQGLSDEHPARRNENVFAFSMAAASLEVLQLLSMVVMPAGVPDGAQVYHFVTGTIDRNQESCRPECAYSTAFLGLGDHVPLQVTGPHVAAEQARQQRITQPIPHGASTDQGRAFRRAVTSTWGALRRRVGAQDERL